MVVRTRRVRTRVGVLVAIEVALLLGLEEHGQSHLPVVSPCSTLLLMKRRLEYRLDLELTQWRKE